MERISPQKRIIAKKADHEIEQWLQLITTSKPDISMFSEIVEDCYNSVSL